jgi:O-antigen ligase
MTMKILVPLTAGAAYVFLASTYFSIAVNSLALGLMAISWIAIMIVQRRWGVVATPLDFYFLAYCIAEAIATVFSEHRAEAVFVARRVLLIGIVYFFASRLESVTAAKRAVAVLLGSAGIVALLGVLKLVTGGPGENTRLEIFQFYMTTAELMMIALLLVLPFVVHRATPPKVRAAAALVLLPVAVSLYATVTRGAYLAAAAGIIFIALARNRKLLIPFIILVAALLLFAPPYVAGRLQSIIDIHHPENASRLILWETGLRIFAAHPVVGVGDIDLGELLRQYAAPGYTGEWGHLHNIALHVLVTLGIVGFAAVAAMFVRIFITEWRVYRTVRDDWFAGSVALGALAVFVGFQVNGLTEWSFGDQEVVVLLWVSLGFTLAAGRLHAAAAEQGRG